MAGHYTKIFVPLSCCDPVQASLFTSLMRQGLSPKQMVHEVMQLLVEAHVGLDLCRDPNPMQGLTYLLYMFGAVATLCDSLNMDREEMLGLFEDLLEFELGGYTPDEVENLMNVVIGASDEPTGKLIMKEGSLSVTMYISENALSPARIRKMFMVAGS